MLEYIHTCRRSAASFYSSLQGVHACPVQPWVFGSSISRKAPMVSTQTFSVTFTVLINSSIVHALTSMRLYRCTMYYLFIHLNFAFLHNMHVHNTDSSLLPTAATCFNALTVPQYPSKAVLRQKLEVAIAYGQQTFLLH